MRSPDSRSRVLKLVGCALVMLSVIAGSLQLASPTAHATSCIYYCRISPTMCAGILDVPPYDECTGPCSSNYQLPWCGGGGGEGCPGDPNCNGKSRRPN